MDAGADVADDGYAFTLDPSGRAPIKPAGLSHSFAALGKAAGVSRVSLHTLRHFSASMLIASGRPTSSSQRLERTDMKAGGREPPGPDGRRRAGTSYAASTACRPVRSIAGGERDTARREREGDRHDRSDFG